MNEFIAESAFFGVSISLLAYYIGTKIKKRFKSAVFNPLLITIVLVIATLLALRVDYDSYYSGAKYLSYLLIPATVSLAVPLYQQWQLLKTNALALMLGIISGMLTSLVAVLAFAVILGFDHKDYVTLLPKSITTAIGMGISKELGGYVAITVAAIVITGILGNVIAETLLKFFKITNPIAKGIAIGSASHAMGTAKAMELGEIEGAMSSLSIVVSGILTVVGATVFSYIY
ncbi:MAG: LrgB family protein [Lachnospiraceae bacterium]|nr:LrgB family protein [Lachnospiraceae bacterium]